MIPRIFTLLTAAVLLVLVASAAPTASSLFRDDPQVIDLPSAAARRLHANAYRCPWVVMVYNPHCGHCRNMKPKFAAFAASFKHDKPVLFGAISCVASANACHGLGIQTVPTFVTATFSGTKMELPEKVEKDPSVTYAIVPSFDSLETSINYLLASISLSPEDAAMCQNVKAHLVFTKSTRIQKAKTVSRRGDAFVQEERLFPQDIAGAAFLAMWDEVPMVRWTEDSRSTLTEFLNAIELALPALNTGSLRSVLANEQGHALDMEIWKAAVERANIPYKGSPTDVQWATCRGSTWDQRGLPCGQWALFHALTVNSPRGEAKKALDSVRSYVAKFFTCYECRQHFAAIPYTLTDAAGTDDDAILWLWEAHNSVNERLANSNDGSSDPKVPKVRWPTRALCTACFKTKADDVAYDRTEVARFLRKWYDWASIVTLGAPTEAAPTAMLQQINAETRGMSTRTGKPRARLDGLLEAGADVVMDNERHRQELRHASTLQGNQSTAWLVIFAAAGLVAIIVCRSLQRTKVPRPQPGWQRAQRG
jgi:thiol-disulfide isomerase/thioredoxin